MNVVRYMLLSEIQSEGNFNDNVSKCIFLAYEHGTLRDNLKKKKGSNLIAQYNLLEYPSYTKVIIVQNFIS